MKCSSCGFENEPGSKFCQSCGGNLAEEAHQTGAPGGGTPPPPPPPPSSAPIGGRNIDIGGWISKAFNEVFGDIMNYILLGLVVVIVSGITLGILAGPMYAGALIVIRKKLRGEGALEIGEVFNEGFKYFLPTFLLIFISILVITVLQFIPVVGQIVGIVIAGFLGPFWAIGVHYITEEKMDFMPAATKAFETFMTNPLMIWVFGILAGIIAGIGAIVCVIGVLVTMPVSVVMMALMLEDFFPKKR